MFRIPAEYQLQRKCSNSLIGQTIIMLVTICGILDWPKFGDIMNSNLNSEVKKVICSTIQIDIPAESLSNDFKLAGNALDSMAVTSLIVGLEEHFCFMFDESELSAENFETVDDVVSLVQSKL